MSTDTMVRTMAKRNDSAVKVDSEVVSQAKMVASGRGITLAEYLSELLRPLVARDLDVVYQDKKTKSSAPIETSKNKSKRSKSSD